MSRKPPIAQPAIKITTESKPTSDAPPSILFGGAPRLPGHMEWPRGLEGQPLHFFCQIDLDALPRDHRQAGKAHQMPDFPDTGTLFIFMSLDNDRMYGGDNIAVLFEASPLDDNLPERAPPDDTPVMDDESHVADLERVTPCGTMLHRQYGSTVTYLSYRAENPLWRNMERAASPEEVYERDLAYAAQLKELGIEHPVELPIPMAAREPLYEDIPTSMQGFFERGTFRWEWEYIFEWAKRVFAACHELGLREAMDILNNKGDSQALRKFMSKLGKRKSAAEASRFDGNLTLWERFSCDHAPALDMRWDVQFFRWMNYARYSHRKGTAMGEQDKRDFVAMLQKLDREGDSTTPANLKMLARIQNHDIEVWDLYDASRTAFRNIASERSDLHPDRATEPQHNFGDDDARPTQMFGCGYLLQSAAIEHEDDILLLQTSNCAGAEFDRYDMLFQMWIAQEDLAGGEFSRVKATLEMS